MRPPRAGRALSTACPDGPRRRTSPGSEGMNELATDEPIGELEVVHESTGPMPTGVSVSHTGRVFVNFPQWGDDPPATVVELRDGSEVPFPDEAWNSASGKDDA